MAGWRLRGYTVEDLIGRGATSEVWRARVTGSAEPVALKRLYLTDADQARRAVAEAAALRVLDHPNLVRLHAVVPTPEASVLVLDLAEGGSLAALLDARGRLTPGEVITAVAPVAAALAYVHRRGVVHGDVTPANLLFTPGGVSLLADLGVARLTGDERDAESTPAYVDPAVATGSLPAAASDVFMLGGVALHALTGEPTWCAADADAALAAARVGDVSHVADRLDAAGVPPEMAAVICRALTLDPARRCTAADFALDLRHSGTPVAVELSAGRGADAVVPVAPAVGESAGYNETSPRVGGPIGAGASAGVAVRASLVAPGGERPGYEPRHRFSPDPAASALPPTNAVRRPRPEIPRRPQRRFAVRDVRRAGVLAAAAVAVLAVVAVVVAALTRPADQPRQRPIADGVDWVAALRAADSARAEAFANRDASLLERVYVAGPLLRADTALLRRLVPSTCSLTGAVTRYDDIQLRASAGRATIAARASIPASILRCRGRPDRVAAAVAPTAVVVDLVLTGDGPRIAALRAG